MNPLAVIALSAAGAGLLIVAGYALTRAAGHRVVTIAAAALDGPDTLWDFDAELAALTEGIA